MIQVVSGQDHAFAIWAHNTHGTIRIPYDSVFGLMKGDKIVGAFMFNNYNYSDVELHFYGKRLFNKAVIKEIAARAILLYRINRMTMKPIKGLYRNSLPKLGAVFECTQRRAYGPTDADRHAADVYVLYRERLEQLAGLGSHGIA